MLGLRSGVFSKYRWFFLWESRTVPVKTIYPVLSLRAEAGTMGPVTEVLCTGYCHKKIEGINSSQPEVKASQLVKRLRSYSHLKTLMQRWPHLWKWYRLWAPTPLSKQKVSDNTEFITKAMHTCRDIQTQLFGNDVLSYFFQLLNCFLSLGVSLETEFYVSEIRWFIYNLHDSIKASNRG